MGWRKPMHLKGVWLEIREGNSRKEQEGPKAFCQKKPPTIAQYEYLNASLEHPYHEAFIFLTFSSQQLLRGSFASKTFNVDVSYKEKYTLTRKTGISASPSPFPWISSLSPPPPAATLLNKTLLGHCLILPFPSQWLLWLESKKRTQLSVSTIFCSFSF